MNRSLTGRVVPRTLMACLSLLLWGGAGSVGVADDPAFELRPFRPVTDGEWRGRGISYGPYREGQAPGGVTPSREQFLEDLEILSKRWDLLRMYGARQSTEEVLQLIREKGFPLKVMVGAWITRETPRDGETEEMAATWRDLNRAEVAAAIKLANAYPDVVVAVSVGNESQVYWSDHKTDRQILIDYIRTARKGTAVPVTTADDFNFWNRPESRAVAQEVDFIVTHVYAMWGGVLLDDAVPWTQRIYQEVVAAHPDRTVVIGEAGWATQRHTEGDQAKYINGRAGEAEQRRFFEEYTSWVEGAKICSFYFEAFDEPWKGGPHPNEIEKHWGLYDVDRQPKAAMQP